MTGFLASVAVGLGGGALAGAFGVGGGILTTPAVRLLLGYPALVAVGTPLVAVIPGAIVGAYTHARAGRADVRVGLLAGAWGAVAAVLGARLSAVAGGTTVMLVTALAILWGAITVLRRPPEATEAVRCRARRTHVLIAILGVTTGLYSGFLGLGGGVVLVPLLHRFFGYPVKTAIGTSLVAIAVLAVPGSITHALLGHVDPMLALGLSIGVMPGALVGALITGTAGERGVRIAFACMLGAVGIVLGLSETGVL